MWIREWKSLRIGKVEEGVTRWETRTAYLPGGSFCMRHVKFDAGIDESIGYLLQDGILNGTHFISVGHRPVCIINCYWCRTC